MLQTTSIILAVFGSLWLLAVGGFSWLSHTEGERRAARVALVVALGGGVIFFLAMALPMPVQWLILGMVCLIGIAAIILFFLPIGKIELGNDIPSLRFDERETMFARHNLQPGTPNYESYYTQHPEHRVGDDHTRSLPGLFSPQAKFTNPYHSASMRGSFRMTHALWAVAEGPVTSEQQTLPTEQMTAYITGLARYFGALDVGVTQLQPYHVYSHIGRGPGVYGDSIENSPYLCHRFFSRDGFRYGWYRSECALHDGIGPPICRISPGGCAISASHSFFGLFGSSTY